MNRLFVFRTASVIAALLLSACAVSGCTVSAETENVNADGYDLSGFAVNFPEKFAKDDTVTITADRYQSHDICIELSRHKSPYLSGDLTGDRKVTVLDAVAMGKYLSEDASVKPTDVLVSNADCDLSGSADLMDLHNMLAYLSGNMTAEDFFAESSLVYHVAQIYIRDIQSFRGCFAKDQFPPKGSYLCDYALNVAPKNNALLMINADYVECRSSGVIWRNGVHYRDVKFSSDVCVLFRSGEMKNLTYNEYTALSEDEKAQIWQTSNFSKAIVKNGEPQVFARSDVSGSLNACHPRSTMGYYEPGHYVFVQVDGRQAGYSAGMYMDELAALYTELGVQEAYNLDGGSSSSLVYNGALYNTPAPVHVGDVLLGRPTSDFFYICEPSQIPADLAAEAWGDTPPET